jgi:HEAT repeat protein
MRTVFVLVCLSLLLLGTGTPAADDFGAQVDALLTDLGSKDAAVVAKAQQTLFQLTANASRPGADAESDSASKALCERLPKTGPEARVWLLSELRRIGRAECVPALAAQLADADAHVREAARAALQANPSTEATQALLKALQSAEKKDAQVAFINALGRRVADTATVEALIGKLATDDDVRLAAAAALAQIGDPRAVEPLTKAQATASPQTQGELTDTLLLLADRLCAKKSEVVALAVYRKLLGDGKGHVKCAALIGLARAGSTAELPSVLQAMGDADFRMRGSAVEASRLLPGKEITAALTEKLKGGSKELKVSILRALTFGADVAAKPAFLEAATDADEDLRVEALRGLCSVGDGSTVAVLLKAALAGGRSADVARQSLDFMAAKDANEALVAALKDPDVKVRAEAARSLGARHVTSSVPALMQAAEGEDAALRNEALKALVNLAGASHVDALVKLAAGLKDASASDAVVAALFAAALQNENEAGRADPLVAGYVNASPQGKQTLLRAMSRLGGAKALDALRSAAKDADGEIQKAAVRALGEEWPDLSAAGDLLELSKSAPNAAIQILALRGYIRLAGLAKPADTAKMSQVALETAKRPDEKRLVLKGLGEVRDPVVFKVLEPLLTDASLFEEACVAILNVCGNLKGKDAAAAKPALEKVVETTKRKDTKQKAQDLLDGKRR